MLYTLSPNVANNIYIRVWGIVYIAILTGFAAQVSIPREPVPITLQVLAVLLAGLILGARDGFLSQVTYLSLIAAGFPFAANGLGGMVAFQTPSTGYLYAFPIAAGVVGLLALRPNFLMRWGASLVGVAIIYTIGASYLKFYLNISWEAAWTAGVAPFLAIDMAKAVLAAASGEGLRQWWLRLQGL